MNIPQFVLASASPARHKLLQIAGIEPVICPSNFDESEIEITEPRTLVQTLAKYKAEKVSSQFQDALILGCDSILAIEGEIYGKPASQKEAFSRWQKMRGKEGVLYTGHVLIDQTQNQTIIDCGITKVYFADISDDMIQDYVASDEPLKCAGAFALEGKGGLFVEKIEGCHSNVIGLSLPLLRQMMSKLKYSITDFWY